MIEKPIQLTHREREVANLMIKGMTRPEISRILAISDNTVKKHIDNIIDKSDASNQREAAIYIYRNDFIYGANEINANFFVDKRIAKIELIDETDSYLKSYYELTCCKNNIEYYDADIFSDGEIEYVEIDDKKEEPMRKERGLSIYRTNFDPKMNIGQTVKRNVTAKLKNSFVFPNDYFYIDQTIPCGQLNIIVEMPRRFIFKAAEFEASIAQNVYTPPFQDISQSKNQLSWTIDAPQILSRFTIRWKIMIE